ncbi:RICIN domain-containing protein [Parabacteroides sp. FAFU027]|uniref:RICIN domain-containing protein n=1 Tax=Parabacteroides sp. FAFU027 TaxID=2922715 RepID=UPI001FAFE575|nr:RICIN domain-containing protein [Parabacteroides sp. FAFU027]
MKKLVLIFVLGLIPFTTFAWPGMPLPALHVEGRYLKDPCGNNINLHGVAITPSPWFNGCASGTCRWDNYDIQGCLNYNNAVMDKLTSTSQGWYLNYIRLHIDPYWTNNPGTSTTGESDISQFNYNRLVTYTNSVIIPLINHARDRGMYVILRPPGVCPQTIAANDAYYNYLVTVWTYLSQNSALKNAPNVMFELANEPVVIKASDGTYGNDDQKYYDALKNFFQPIVNLIRNNGANNVVWVPGLGYQSLYRGLANNPVTGNNIGYAVHVYPGYWGVGLNDAANYQNAWNAHIAPVANIAPIAITETDWAPTQYGVFGKGGLTSGFGNKLKQLIDASGNVSWNVLMPEDLINNGDPSGGIAFNNDPEACANPVYSWFKAYATSNTPASACSLENNGVYEIEIQTDPGKVLDLYNGTDANGTVIRPWDRNGASAQQWKAIDAGNGYWRFVSMASATNRCIDLYTANPSNGTQIKLWDYYNNDAQAWKVTSLGGGYYQVLSKVAVGQGLTRGWDIPYCNMDGSQGMQLYDYIASSCQKYKFNYKTTLKSAMITTGVDATPASSVVIFPNPSVGGNFTITLQNVNDEDSYLSIYSIEGKKVYEREGLNAGDNYIQSALKAGIYIVKIKCGEKTSEVKLIVR